MASTASISTAIDDLIPRMNAVNVCQDYIKLIVTTLTRLRNALNESNALINRTDSYENIDLIIKAIDEVITNCNEINDKDLKSVLFRLQWRLVEYEANLMDDDQIKVQMLTNAYHDLNNLDKQLSSDQTIRQKLEEIEQQTKENTVEQHRLLREKHTTTIEPYLRTSVELHKSVPLTGVTSNTITTIMNKFYNISNQDQSQTEHNLQPIELPLTDTFVHLVPDKSTTFENKLQSLITKPNGSQTQHNLTTEDEESSKSICQRIISTPHMLAIAERNRAEQKKNLTKENIIKTKRSIVILGDPGCGKTSFTRWLTHHLAQTLLLNNQHSTDYGPLRIPILIRIGEYADTLKQHPSLSLFDYIGKHQWMGKHILAHDASISTDELACALQDYIKHGQALVILDGLDEIPASDLRSRILHLVEQFVDTYIQTPTGVSFVDDDPSRTGGNQIIVTSRIVGYHAAPLPGQFVHYTIRPMDTESIKKFVDYWFFQVHQQILDVFRSTSTNQSTNHSDTLKKELDKPENHSLLDAASNPYLLSLLCTISINQAEGPPFLNQRICLYEQIVNSMLDLLNNKQSTIPKSKLIPILTDIAFHIYKYSSSNLIHKDDITEVCFPLVKASTHKVLLTSNDVQDLEQQAHELSRILRQDVDILIARDESSYGFLYSIFQEYFTCLKLIEVDRSKQKKLHDDDDDDGLDKSFEIKLIVQSLRNYSNDPRFRVPIALALGKLSSLWSQKDFDDFCHIFLQEEYDSDVLLPFGPYTLITCANQYVNYPSNNIFSDALNCLILKATQHNWSIVCPFLFKDITDSLTKLPTNSISAWTESFLEHSPPHDIHTISTLCYLIEGKPHHFDNIKWLNQASCSLLQSFLPFDNEHNQFAIDRLLVKVAFSNHQLLPVDQNTLKEFLLTENIQSSSIPVALFPLIIILYGGLKRDGQTVLFDPSYIHRESSTITPILLRFLSIKDPTKQDQALKKLKQECIRSFLAKLQEHDESSETIDLCIAAVCLYDIEYVQENLSIISPSILSQCMNRLKYFSMILRQLYFPADKNDHSIENETTRFISLAMEKFQYGESARVQFLDLLDVLRGGVARLRSSTTSTLVEGQSRRYKRLTLHLPSSLRKDNQFLNGLLSTDIQFGSDRSSCSLLHHFTKLFWILENDDGLATQYRIYVAMDKVPEYLVFRNDQDLLSSLIFIRPHLQNLYLRLLQQKLIIIDPFDVSMNDRQNLYFGHILTECLMMASNASSKRLIMFGALITLLPWLRLHSLETFGSGLLWALAVKHPYLLATVHLKVQRPINVKTGQYLSEDDNIFAGSDMVDEQRRARIIRHTRLEHKRLKDALTRNNGNNMKLYSASVSLAHLCHWSDDERRLNFFNDSLQGAMFITNKIARLDALCIIALYSHSDSDPIQVSTGRSIKQEIQHQFKDIYPSLPLLLHAAMFVRCLPILEDQQMIDECLTNLFQKFGDNDRRDQEAVTEAISPYLQSLSGISSITKYTTHIVSTNTTITGNKSSMLKKYLNVSANQSSSYLVFLSNLYLMELAKDFHQCIKTDQRQFTTDEFAIRMLLPLENSILTEIQAIIITNTLSSISLLNQSKHSESICDSLSNALHHVDLAEFKARYLLESWLKWKNSNELSVFAYHAALLLANSDLWSVEAATVICDLLRCENDRFRRRAENLFHSWSDHDIRTSSKMGIDVLLVLAKKRAQYDVSSASAKLNLSRFLTNITLDIQSHLETFLWLERYRVHALTDREYCLNTPRAWTHPYVADYFSGDVSIIDCSCINMIALSGDLITYMCDMIACNFFSYMEINGDSTSDIVSESHTQFIISVLVTLHTILNKNDETSQVAIEALTGLFNMSENEDVRRAIAYTFGSVCSGSTYKTLFEKLQMVSNNGNSENSSYSDQILADFISSYAYCLCTHKIPFDVDDMDLFSNLSNHSSNVVIKAVRTAYARVFTDQSFLLEMLGSDYIQCYYALVGATAHLYLRDVQEKSEIVAAKFIEENPILLPIFLLELYNSICHFTENVSPIGGIEYNLAHGYPQYVRIASLVAIEMPVVFCDYVNSWSNCENLKRALFYTSKQHYFPQRAACLTILSILGELTANLCEMFIDALHDDPHIQNSCYKSLTRINSIKDEKAVLDRLLLYSKSKSMNVRYMTAKILLHLSKSSLMSFKQVQKILNDVILDPTSNEDLLLIEEQDAIHQQTVYYYAGSLKDVVYSLLIQHVTRTANRTIRRNRMNMIDLDFVEAEETARFASCLYETKTASDGENQQVSPSDSHKDDDEDSVSSLDGIISDDDE